MKETTGAGVAQKGQGWMNVLVIDPGHGSTWLEDARFVGWDGEPDPDGERVTGTAWSHDSGPNLPDGGIDLPETLTYPRSLILKVEEGWR